MTSYKNRSMAILEEKKQQHTQRTILFRLLCFSENDKTDNVLGHGCNDGQYFMRLDQYKKRQRFSRQWNERHSNFPFQFVICCRPFFPPGNNHCICLLSGCSLLETRPTYCERWAFLNHMWLSLARPNRARCTDHDMSRTFCGEFW
jgi:hypothetical protein